MARNHDSERTLAAAEAEETQQGGSDTRCVCGSTRFVLEAFLEIEDGKPNPEPVEVEALTCPECNREFEPVLAENGRVLRGDFIGFFEEDDE